MKLGIDVMGGDFAPLQTSLGVLEALAELPEHIHLVLFGDSAQITQIIGEHNPQALQKLEIVDAPDVISMNEHPTKAISQKPNSSIATGFQWLKEQKIDAFCSAGNTGAMMVGAMFSVKPVEGIIRPSLTTLVPKENGKIGVLLDVGANADCKPEVLQQFALLGSLLAQYVYNMPSPSVGLINIGEEEEKGNMLTQAAHQLLKKTSEINFVGNIESRDIFGDSADVLVCDGFTGNVILKLAESFYTLVRKRGLKDSYFDRFNYENYGGSPILGVNAPVVIGHGISNARAIKNMIKLTKEVTEAKLSERIKDALKTVDIT